MTLFNVVDLETTGFFPNASCVEIAVTPLTLNNDDNTLHIGKTKSSLMKPNHRIDLNAMAIHHIREDHVALKRPHDEVIKEYMEMECDYWVAHNASFEKKFLSPKQPWICTLQVARALYPDAPNHKCQVLRYHLGLDKVMDQSRVDPAHRAGPDTYVTAALLGQMIMKNVMTVDDMVALCNKGGGSFGGEERLACIPFGKHKGTPYSKIPKDYLRWLLANSSDEMVLTNIKKVIK